MKINFHSPPPAGIGQLPPRIVKTLDSLPDGSVYEGRDIARLTQYSPHHFAKCGRAFREAGYCTLITGDLRLWWGNKATIAALKKQTKL
jgi:hypothetical protein